MKGAIGNTIRVRRKFLVMTQKELAKRTGLTEAGISNLERGETLPSLATLQAISEVLEVPMVTLLEAVKPAEDPDRAKLYGRLMGLAASMGYEDLEKAAEILEVLARDSAAEDG